MISAMSLSHELITDTTFIMHQLQYITSIVINNCIARVIAKTMWAVVRKSRSLRMN